ncbi:hypothetical protein FHETE_10281 [Fusarium heterosporum]|uniref:Copper-fist domain-containing protein n=1 Tax=Fusarium heterosporum TaxID=42747 RepID=A0A8H5WF43_FUSHE|nr:hypothetical protein FHETE_10281 [Fusarium heterosporum]
MVADTRKGRHLDGKKFACKKCFDGHRTEACVPKHMNDLRWISQRGRPATGSVKVNPGEPTKLCPEDVARVGPGGSEETLCQGRGRSRWAQPVGEQRVIRKPLPISDAVLSVKSSQQMGDLALPLGLDEQPSLAAPPYPPEMSWAELNALVSQPEPQAAYPTPPAEQAMLQDRPQQMDQLGAQVWLGGMGLEEDQDFQDCFGVIQTPPAEVDGDLWKATFSPSRAKLATMPGYQQDWYWEWSASWKQYDLDAVCRLLQIRWALKF